MIGIINTGFGNINSIKNIYYENSIETKIINTSEDLDTYSGIILPGIGSFDTLISKLEELNIIDQLTNYVLKSEKPILGICIGMQAFYKSSSEGHKKGLCWIDGDVEKLNMNGIRLPHMGWNKVFNTTENPLFNNIPEGSSFYFLHSYANKFNETESSRGTVFTNYGEKFVSAICKKNIFGVQFHPEKSHSNGIKLLINFARIND